MAHVAPFFLLDENISYKIAVALSALDLPFEHVLNELEQGSDDIAVFDLVNRRNWFLVTQDKRIRRRKHERQAMLATGLGVFVFMGRANKSVAGMTQLILKCHIGMIDAARKTKRPFVYGVTDHGKLDRLD